MRSSDFHWGSQSIDGSEVDGWIASEGHRRNLLGPFNVCGIGAGVVGNLAIFFAKKPTTELREKKQKQRDMSWFGGLEKSFERIYFFRFTYRNCITFFMEQFAPKISSAPLTWMILLGCCSWCRPISWQAGLQMRIASFMRLGLNHGTFQPMKLKTCQSRWSLSSRWFFCGFEGPRGIHQLMSKVVSTHLWNTPLNLSQQAIKGFLS